MVNRAVIASRKLKKKSTVPIYFKTLKLKQYKSNARKSAGPKSRSTTEYTKLLFTCEKKKKKKKKKLHFLTVCHSKIAGAKKNY